MNDEAIISGSNSTTLYPASWFRLGEPETDNTHTTVCHAAGLSALDEEIAVSEIENVEESLPNEYESFCSGCQVAWYYVGEVGQQYGRVVRVLESEAKRI